MGEGGDATEVTVLFVDDSATDRVRGVGLIRKQSPEWNVVPVASAAEGLEQLDRRQISIVVTDLVMPGMDGRQFLQVINEKYPMIPVVLVTSQGNDQIAAQSMELGAVNYVPKRLLANDLVPALQEILKARRESSGAQNVMSHLIRNRSKFSIDNDLEQIRALVHLVRNRLHSLNRVPADTVVNLTASVREALLNAYFHGNLELESTASGTCDADFIQLAEIRKQDSQYSGRQIELEMLVDSEQLVFRVTDDGQGFDPSNVLTQSVQAGKAPDAGFQQIARHVDIVSFNEIGNQVTLTTALQSTTRV